MREKIRVCVLICMGLVCAAGAASQGLTAVEAAPASPAVTDIDAEGHKLAGLIGRRISALTSSGEKPLRVRVEEFSNGGIRSAFGSLWTQNLISALGNLENRNFTVTLDTAPPSAAFTDFILAGQIIEAGPIVRVVTRLVKTEGRELAASWSTDFQKSSFIQGLLAPKASSFSETGSSARTVQRDIYETDSREAPAPFSVGSDWVTRTFHDSGDKDWFLITVDRPRILRVETGGGLDTAMELYQGASAAVEENDDGGEGLNACIEYYVAVGESCIVGVCNYDRETGEYRFRAFIKDFEEDVLDTKSNNTRGQALELDFAAGRIVTLFDSSTDQDWYSFTIPEGGGRLVAYTSGNRDTVISLYNADGKEIETDDDSGSDYNASLNVRVPAGTVYLCLSELEEVSGLYTLHFSLEK
jgi:hypothetical protein